MSVYRLFASASILLLFRKFWSGAIEKLDNVATKINTNNISISENPEYLFISESISINTSLPG